MSFEEAIKQKAFDVKVLIEDRNLDSSLFGQHYEYYAHDVVQVNVVLAEYRKAQKATKDIIDIEQERIDKIANAYTKLVMATTKEREEQKQKLQQFYIWLRDWSNDEIVIAKFKDELLKP